MTKLCTGCSTEKDSTQFYKAKRKDGLSWRCKICHKAATKTHISNNKQYYKDYLRDYKRNRSSYDVNFRLAGNLRNRIWNAVKGNTRSIKSSELLGCSIEHFKTHLEQKFQIGMSWDNYGKWHIDHIIPLISFDLENQEELKKACHYTNLQPLWAKDNQAKSGRIIST